MSLELVEAQGYIVTDKGKVLGKNGRPLKIRIHKGKPRVSLSITENNVRKDIVFSVHRLVAEKFCKVRPTGCNHVLIKDGNPSNLRPNNLRWASLAQCKEWGDSGYLKQLSIEGLMSLKIHWRETSKHNLSQAQAYRIWVQARKEADEKLYHRED